MHKEICTILINGQIWFSAKDVCGILGITDHLQAVEKLDDEEKILYKTSYIYRAQKEIYINELAVYKLLFLYSNENTKDFQNWIYYGIVPIIRRTNFYDENNYKIPTFIRKYNENWDRLDIQYFSVVLDFYEFVSRLYLQIKDCGYSGAEKVINGEVSSLDILIDRYFSDWLIEQYPEYQNYFKMYKHIFLDGKEIDARQYKIEIWHIFMQYMDDVWIKERAHNYFNERDPNAIEYLALLIPDFKTSAAAIDHDGKK